MECIVECIPLCEAFFSLSAFQICPLLGSIVVKCLIRVSNIASCEYSTSYLVSCHDRLDYFYGGVAVNDINVTLLLKYNSSFF